MKRYGLNNVVELTRPRPRQDELPSGRRARRIVAVGGGKGGIGKSLVSANLGIALARAGHRVTLVDVDLGGANLHTCLGINQPQGTLSDVVTKGTRIESLAAPTGIENLTLVSGAMDALDAANPRAQARARLVEQLQTLDADYLLLDLGAGTSLHTIDFFLLADHGVLVLLPEPTSVENAYRFLKAALFRRLQQTAQALGWRPRRGRAGEPGQRDADAGRGGQGRRRVPPGGGGSARAVAARVPGEAGGQPGPLGRGPERGAGGGGGLEEVLRPGHGLPGGDRLRRLGMADGPEAPAAAGGCRGVGGGREPHGGGRGAGRARPAEVLRPMTVTEEPTLYDVLEVDPTSSIDELRAAVDRARETFGTESLAVYALVDEEQLGELRARLDEAAEVLLDPARRASYDRSIGRIGPATLWAEDDDEDEAPLPPVEPGPHAVLARLDADDEADESEEPEEPDEGEAEAPRQHALALDVPEARGPFGRGVAEGRDARQGLLSGDWAAAVPKEHAARPAPDPASAPPRVEREAVEPEPLLEPVAGPTEADAVPERSGLPPSLGLRLKPAPQPPVAEVVAPEPVPAPPAAPPPSSVAPERPPEHATRPRESRNRLDIAADAEFNGELLRRVRESYGLSLQQVAERTRITRIHLENVEADRYDKLPATVYLRGILVNLARELRLDPARVSKTYLLATQRAHARGS